VDPDVPGSVELAFGSSKFEAWLWRYDPAIEHEPQAEEVPVATPEAIPWSISATHGMGRREMSEPTVVPALSMESFQAARAAEDPRPEAFTWEKTSGWLATKLVKLEFMNNPKARPSGGTWVPAGERLDVSRAGILSVGIRI
jgi:hypothetical protein